jgi:hypothetical protein
MSRSRVVVIVVLCTLAILVGAAAWLGKPRTTPAEIHALIGEETPIGSTPQRVVAFLDSARIERSPYHTHDRSIYALWRRTSVRLLSESSIQVRFFFDEENRLSRYEVEEMWISQ